MTNLCSWHKSLRGWEADLPQPTKQRKETLHRAEVCCRENKSPPALYQACRSPIVFPCNTYHQPFHLITLPIKLSMMTLTFSIRRMYFWQSSNHCTSMILKTFLLHSQSLLVKIWNGILVDRVRQYLAKLHTHYCLTQQSHVWESILKIHLQNYEKPCAQSYWFIFNISCYLEVSGQQHSRE